MPKSASLDAILLPPPQVCLESPSILRKVVGGDPRCWRGPLPIHPNPREARPSRSRLMMFSNQWKANSSPHTRQLFATPLAVDPPQWGFLGENGPKNCSPGHWGRVFCVQWWITELSRWFVNPLLHDNLQGIVGYCLTQRGHKWRGLSEI